MENADLADFLAQLLVGLILSILGAAAALMLTIAGVVWKLWSKIKEEMEALKLQWVEFMTYAKGKFELNDEQHDELLKFQERCREGHGDLGKGLGNVKQRVAKLEGKQS